MTAFQRDIFKEGLKEEWEKKTSNEYQEGYKEGFKDGFKEALTELKEDIKKIENTKFDSFSNEQILAIPKIIWDKWKEKINKLAG